MKDYVEILRPKHWTKNVFVFAGLVFGRKLAAPADEALAAVEHAFAAFGAFCLASSAVYIFNDLMDRKSDRLHAQKAWRPISAGRIRPEAAMLMLLACGAGAVAIGAMTDRHVTYVLVLYMVALVAYSLGLKRVMILDCILISAGFCLRAVAGAVAVKVFISPWLVICTFALCLFLAFGKRQSELVQLGVNAEAFRQTLAGYTPQLLSHMLSVTSGMAVMCFLLYTMDARTQALFDTQALAYTTPLVLFCVFRFSAQIQRGTFSGPVEFILRDRPFQVGFVLWVLACGAIVYHRQIFGFLCIR